MTEADVTEWPTNLKIRIPDATIDKAKGCDPYGCAIQVEVKKAIGGHGYVRVDSSGIAVTRRSDFREKAFLPRHLQEWMIAFDLWRNNKGPRPRPITAHLKFFKTTKIGKTRNKTDAGHMARQARQRDTRKRLGTNIVYGKRRRYSMRRRIEGLSIAT